MTDTTDRPPIHYAVARPSLALACGGNAQRELWTDRAQDVTCVECWGYRKPGHSHTIKQVCKPETCTGHPRWAEIRADETPDLLREEITKLAARAVAAETERDAYREAIAGGRAWLGLVVPELVYPQRVVLPTVDAPGDFDPGTMWTLPPDPLTLLRQEVADLTAAVGRLADQGREERPEPARLACSADQFCEATAHYVGCPSYTQRDLAAEHRARSACQRQHPGEPCKPGENHPGAAG